MESDDGSNSDDDVSELLIDCHYSKSGFSTSEPEVKGRLAQSVEFWENTLEAPPFIIDVIKHAYSLPFREFPPSCFLSNNRSALRNPQFARDAILELLRRGLLEEHSSPPHCVTVAEGKKLRLVIDLREVNKYLMKPKFHYENLRSLSEIFEQGFWFFTWDLKSGYHHVDIFRPRQQFLGFTWDDFDGVVRYFTFWFEHRLFLLHQALAPFSQTVASYVSQLFRVFERWDFRSS